MQLYNITLKNLLRRKAKMIFVLLGITIGIATIVSVYSIVETMKIDLTRQVSEFGVNVVIKPNTSGLTFSYGGITLPEVMYDVEKLSLEDVNSIENLNYKDMIKVISPKLLGMDTLKGGQKVIVVGANIREEFLIKPWMRLEEEKTDSKQPIDYTENNNNKKMDFEELDLRRQDLSELQLNDNQIIMGYNIANFSGVKKGDTLKLLNNEFEVYGILLESGSFEDMQILMNLNSAQRHLNRLDEITVIDMAVDYEKGSEETLLSEIKKAIPNAQVSSLRQETLRRDEMLTRLVNFGMTMSLIILLVGTFVVALTMSNSVRERTREIGVFRAIGYRKSHIIKIIIMEGIAISIIGGLVGFIFGIIIARYTGPFIAGMDIIIPWRVDLFILSICVAIVIGLSASIYPAYKAAKLDPIEALRFI